MARILLIEDNNDIQEILYSLLSEDHEVLQAFSGTEGLRVFQQEAVDLVLLDIMLPGKNGEQVLEAIQEDIREKNPDFVFVGITSPKKEYLIQKFMDNGVNSVFMGVGGSFDVLSGHIKRAPMWMQKANLEWLFRVANEPKRLFKRYFVGNATFIKRVIHEKRKAKK